MISRLTLRNFKRFREHTFDLADSVVLAGPNNAGKSTLLQAIATWKLGLDRWVAQREGGARRQALGGRDHAGGFHGRAAPRDEPLCGRTGRSPGRPAWRTRGGLSKSSWRERPAASRGHAESSSSTPTGNWSTPAPGGRRISTARRFGASRRRRHRNWASFTSRRCRALSATSRAATGACRICWSARAGRARSCGISCSRSPSGTAPAGRHSPVTFTNFFASSSSGLPIHPRSRTSFASTGRRVTAGRSTSRTPGAARSRCC